MQDNAAVQLFPAAAAEAARLGSKYEDIPRDRDELLEFMDVNDWFGMDVKENGYDTLVMMSQKVKARMELWLKAYKQPAELKYRILLDSEWKRLPETCAVIEAYVEKCSCAANKSTWMLLDYLFSQLSGELTTYSDAKIKELVESAKNALPKASRNLLMELLASDITGKRISKWQYRIEQASAGSEGTSAYSIRDFSVMAYCVFNPESWERNGLIEKAAESERTANLWLFTALHFVSALRATDLCRLPAPNLPYQAEELRQRIVAGAFTHQEASAVSNEVMLRLRLLPLRPHKTRKYSDVSDIKLFIPESLLVPMGIIIALAFSFHTENIFFATPATELQPLERFFGTEFAMALGRKRFSTRRANKSYMQGIEMSAVDEPGKPKGYMLAALARSHKSGIGRLAEITDVYLKDANFTGYRPEFILREMFERGIFSFIPSMLLDAYAGNAYRKLGVHSQTEIICGIGLSAVQLENISLKVEQSLASAREITRHILSECQGDRERLSLILQSIASDGAAAKQKGLLCLQTAVGNPCCCPESSGCLGCKYEIITKSAVQLLSAEYARLNRKRRTVEPGEAARLKHILEDGLLTTIMAMTEEIMILAPNADMEPIYEILERGVENAGLE